MGLTEQKSRLQSSVRLPSPDTLTTSRNSAPGFLEPKDEMFSRSYFPSEPPWDLGAEEHAMPFPAGRRSGYSVNRKQSNSAPVLSLSDEANLKAPVIKKVCEGQGNTRLVTSAERTENAVTLSSFILPLSSSE